MTMVNSGLKGLIKVTLISLFSQLLNLLHQPMFISICVQMSISVHIEVKQEVMFSHYFV